MKTFVEWLLLEQEVEISAAEAAEILSNIDKPDKISNEYLNGVSHPKNILIILMSKTHADIASKISELLPLFGGVDANKEAVKQVKKVAKELNDAETNADDVGQEQPEIGGTPTKEPKEEPQAL